MNKDKITPPTLKNLRIFSFKHLFLMLFKWDATTISLLLTNIISLIIAIIGKLSIGTIMLLYTFQSIIIGFFHFIRILSLKKFTTEGVKINNIPAEANRKTKISLAFFFLFHYGFFHLFYVLIIIKTLGFDTLKITILIPTIILFFINHLFSFYKHLKEDRETTKNIGHIMMFPYVRIIPMHLVIVVGGLVAKNIMGLALFIILKTMMDIISHNLEHNKS